MSDKKAPTRIQQKNRSLIQTAALEVFSQFGLSGSTLDQIAETAGLSKPNVLYYFKSKEAIYQALLAQVLENWLEPLRALDPKGEPVTEILAYAQRKLDLSRDHPRQSRLFAIEIIEGAPRIQAELAGLLKEQVDDAAKVLTAWSEQGKIKPVDPRHLIFTIWAVTQHYADFDVQVRAVLGEDDWFEDATQHLDRLIRGLLQP